MAANGEKIAVGEDLPWPFTDGAARPEMAAGRRLKTGLSLTRRPTGFHGDAACAGSS